MECRLDEGLFFDPLWRLLSPDAAEQLRRAPGFETRTDRAPFLLILGWGLLTPRSLLQLAIGTLFEALDHISVMVTEGNGLDFPPHRLNPGLAKQIGLPAFHSRRHAILEPLSETVSVSGDLPKEHLIAVLGRLWLIADADEDGPILVDAAKLLVAIYDFHTKHFPYCGPQVDHPCRERLRSRRALCFGLADSMQRQVRGGQAVLLHKLLCLSKRRRCLSGVIAAGEAHALLDLVQDATRAHLERSPLACEWLIGDQRDRGNRQVVVARLATGGVSVHRLFISLQQSGWWKGPISKLG